MDLETKLALSWLVVFVMGMLIGWYVTWTKYHQEEEKRKAVLAYKNSIRTMSPPPSYDEHLCNIIHELNDLRVDEYRILDGDKLFVFQHINAPEPKEDETGENGIE
jgi:hypothetical protein